MVQRSQEPEARSQNKSLGHLAVLSLLLAAGCGSPRESHRSAPAAIPGAEEMVRLTGGKFRKGTDSGFPYEGPSRVVEVPPFSIDVHEVTNRQFARFVEATGFKTEAEKWGWSAVFDAQAGEWRKVDGADWTHPGGPASDLHGHEDEPVVQVSWNDAVAYAQWARKRLPSEAEWEFAARGGLDGASYPWGNELEPHGRFLANYWQGSWPNGNTGADGFLGLARVKSFPPNGYGLYDMTGNAWEWVADWFLDAPQGAASAQPAAPTEKVIRGGSFLCNDSYCVGYRVAARNKNTPDSATNNTGFRCVR
jgi:formylglycine-generating enzyme required for sulfatase activity